MPAVITGYELSEAPERIGDGIRAARLAKGWSQAQLAADLGLTATTISRWERGTNLPRPSLVRALSRALDWSPQVLEPAPRPRRGRACVAAAAVRIARGLNEITAVLRDAR